MSFDPDERCDANECRDANGRRDASGHRDVNGRRDVNTSANTNSYTAYDGVDELDELDEQDEQLVRDAFAALPLVPCPDDVVRRIEQTVAETESALGAVVTTTGRHRAPIRWLPTVGSVAAAAALAWLLIAQPTNNSGPTDRQIDGGGTDVDVAAGNVDAGYYEADYAATGSSGATREAKQGLALATQMLQRSEQILFEEAFVKPLPGAIRNSLRKTVSLVQGGRG